MNAVKMKALKTNGVIHQRSLTSCLPDHDDFSRFSRCIPVFSTVKIYSLALSFSLSHSLLPRGQYEYSRPVHQSSRFPTCTGLASRARCILAARLHAVINVLGCKYTARISARARQRVLICVTKRDIQIPTCSQYSRPLAIIRVAWCGTLGWARRRRRRRRRGPGAAARPRYISVCRGRTRRSPGGHVTRFRIYR